MVLGPRDAFLRLTKSGCEVLPSIIWTISAVNRHSTVTHYQRPNMTHPQEGGTGGEVSEILFFSAKSKRHPSLIYSMQIIPVCLSIVARRKGVSATRRGGLNWTPISLLVGHPCKLFHTTRTAGIPAGSAAFDIRTPLWIPLRCFRIQSTSCDTLSRL